MERELFFRIYDIEAFFEISDSLRTLFKLYEKRDKLTIRAYVFTQQPFYFERTFQKEQEADEMEKQLIAKGFIKGHFEEIQLGR